MKIALRTDRKVQIQCCAVYVSVYVIISEIQRADMFDVKDKSLKREDAEGRKYSHRVHASISNVFLNGIISDYMYGYSCIIMTCVNVYE